MPFDPYDQGRCRKSGGVGVGVGIGIGRGQAMTPLSHKGEGMTRRQGYWVGAAVAASFLTIALVTGTMPGKFSDITLRDEPRWYWSFVAIYAALTCYCVMSAFSKRR